MSPPDKAERRCGNCQHARLIQNVSTELTLSCLRFPPQVTVLPGSRPGTIDIKGLYPAVFATGICGEHSPQAFSAAH